MAAEQSTGWIDGIARSTFLRWRFGIVASLLAAIGVASVADYRGVGPGIGALDWLYGASLVVFLGYVVAPLAVDRAAVARYRAALAGDRLAGASLAYVVALLVVGTLAPWILGLPTTNLAHSFQPPAFTSVTTVLAGDCLGPVVDGQCHGTLRYPLGTNGQGESMVRVVVRGSRVTAQVALVSAMLLVPIGTAVGLAAGYRGGLLDQFLMRYVDVQSAIPAFLAYLVLIFVFGRSLFLLVVVFGLLRWGEVARLVRSEALQRSEEEFVRASRSAGASTPFCSGGLVRSSINWSYSSSESLAGRPSRGSS